jgi:hypothetical protein
MAEMAKRFELGKGERETADYAPSLQNSESRESNNGVRGAAELLHNSLTYACLSI